MYPYNYIMPQFQRNMYRQPNRNNQRFIAGGFIAPLLLGGVAGYAIGNNKQNYYPQPYYYPYAQPYPYPTYYNNYYYYNPYNY